MQCLFTNGSLDSKTGLCIRTTYKPALLREFERKCRYGSGSQISGKKAGTIFVHIKNIELYQELISSCRFKGKVQNLFSRPNLCNVVIFSNLYVYETNEYPYFECMPLIKEYKNKQSKFEGIVIE